MKRFLITLAVIILGAASFAEDTVLQGGVTFDWLTITQEQRDAAVENYKSIVFADSETGYTKKNLEKNILNY